MPEEQRPDTDPDDLIDTDGNTDERDREKLPAGEGPEMHDDPDAVAEEASKESFPSSDPPATWAGMDNPS